MQEALLGESLEGERPLKRFKKDDQPSLAGIETLVKERLAILENNSSTCTDVGFVFCGHSEPIFSKYPELKGLSIISLPKSVRCKSDVLQQNLCCGRPQQPFSA